MSKRVFRGFLSAVEGNGFRLVRDISVKGAYSVIVKGGVELVYSGDDVPLLVVSGDAVFPFIGSLDYFSDFKVAYVDRGAVRHITNGADVMAPGIRKGDFNLNDYVVVLLEEFNVPLAIGKALVSYRDMGSRGKAIKNLHYKGDKIWSYVYGEG